MSHLVWKLDHFLIRKLCVATAFLKSGHRRITPEEDMSFCSSIDDIEFGDDGYIWSTYDQVSIYEAIKTANDLLDSVYDGHPPPHIQIEVYQFFEDLFELDL